MWKYILKGTGKTINPKVLPHIDEIMSDGEWRLAATLKEDLWDKLSNLKTRTRATRIMPTSQEISQYLTRSGKYIKSRGSPRKFKMPSKSQRV